MTDIQSSEPTLSNDFPALHTRTCEDCGALLEPLDTFCSGCGTTRFDERKPDEPVETDLEQRHFRCESCGAEVAVDLDQRSYVCAFCDSTYVVEFTPEQTGRQRPEFVIGFAITPDDAMQRFRAWLDDNAWFRPGDLKSARIAEKLHGVYLPFWCCSVQAESRWSASIGEYWYRTETYTTMEKGKMVTRTRIVQETEWWDLAGNHHRYYHQYLVSGSRGLIQFDADRIKPFHLAALKRYRPHYLAGWLNEEYSISREDSREIACREFTRREYQNVADFLPGNTFRNLHVQTELGDPSDDLIFLPIYLLSYRYEDKLYRFLLNGQTGKAAGDKPVSRWRIGFVVALGLIVVGVVALCIAMAN